MKRSSSPNSIRPSPGNGIALIHTASGQRIYGVTCQVGMNTIVYHFLLENYSGTPSAPAYDSPMNFEDYSYQGNVRQWTPANISSAASPIPTANGRVQKSSPPEPEPDHLLRRDSPGIRKLEKRRHSNGPRSSPPKTHSTDVEEYHRPPRNIRSSQRFAPGLATTRTTP